MAEESRHRGRVSVAGSAAGRPVFVRGRASRGRVCPRRRGLTAAFPPAPVYPPPPTPPTQVRWLYKWLHWDHHIYNNSGDMSPFAGLAFHPLDGCAQASPYVLGLFLMPVHFWTHLVLLFFTGVWTTVIHDAVPAGTEPIMGAKYHMYHHTAYRDNYGQFFVFWDWLHGTLYRDVEDGFGVGDAAAAKAADDGSMFVAAAGDGKVKKG
jgi:hypothetical protein